MKNFIVYDKDGNIKRTGCCPDEMFSIQAEEGENIIEGEASFVTDKVENGKVIRNAVAPKQKAMSVMKTKRVSEDEWTEIISRLEAVERKLQKES